MTGTNVTTKDRIRAAAEALWPHVADPPSAHWIGNGDAGMSWCRACAEAEVSRLTAKKPDGDYFVDGGWESHESETSVACEGCGIQLSYTLLRYGVINEVDHFMTYPLEEDGGPMIAYEIYAILEQAKYMNRPEDTEVVADALRIGETAVQLLGYREELARFADDGGPCRT